MESRLAKEIEEIGRKKGKQEGIQEGIQKGRQEGKNKKARETARKLKKMGIEIEKIAKATGISINIIKKL